MNCPHCHQKVSLFSGSMNKTGKVKHCPHCSGRVRLYVSVKTALLWLVPVTLVAFVVSPVLGTLVAGPAGAVAVAMSMRLKAAEPM